MLAWRVTPLFCCIGVCNTPPETRRVCGEQSRAGGMKGVCNTPPETLRVFTESSHEREGEGRVQHASVNPPGLRRAVTSESCEGDPYEQ